MLIIQLFHRTEINQICFDLIVFQEKSFLMFTNLSVADDASNEHVEQTYFCSPVGTVEWRNTRVNSLIVYNF